VREPFRAMPREDMSVWEREYSAWRHSSWTPDDLWATLVATIVDVYQLDDSSAVAPETILREPSA